MQFHLERDVCTEISDVDVLQSLRKLADEKHDNDTDEHHLLAPNFTHRCTRGTQNSHIVPLNPSNHKAIVDSRFRPHSAIHDVYGDWPIFIVERKLVRIDAEVYGCYALAA